MAQQIKLKRSAVAGKVPSTGSLAAGELAINTVDGKLYFKRDDNTIQSIVTTNATITGSVNINGSITGSDIRINQWGSVSASLSAIQASANALTLDNVTDNGNTTTNSVTVGGLTVDTNTLYVDTANKRLGSGTTSPTRNLDLESSAGTSVGIQLNSTAAGGRSYSFFSTNDASSLGGGKFGIYDDTAAAGRIVLDANGNTGFNKNNPAEAVDINGNLLVTGSAKVSGGITGSLLGNASTATTASFALTAPFSGITGKPTLVSSSAQIDLSQATGTAATAVSASYALSASFAVTASYIGAGFIDGTVANATYAANTVINVKNVSGAPIAKGTPLYITGSGTSGNLAGVFPADASNPLRMPAGAIAADAIAAGAEGIGLLNGFINGVNTSAFNSGDEVYVAAGGGYTNIVPTGSNILIQKLGNVEKVDSTNGSGVIHGPGTARNVPNIATGFTWVGNGNGVATPTAVSTLSVASAVSTSHALIADAVNTLNQNVTINGNLTVFGTASFTSVTSSQLVVDDSFISVNVFEPVERFGGLRVYDSGSSQATASLAWDSLHNHWVYQNASGSMYTGGMLLSGPRNTGSLGDEPNLAKWYVPRSDGGDHLDNSQIFSSGSKTDITGSLTTTGKVTIGTVDNYGADPDKFLAIINGEVVYRTGAQLLSDIGGQTAGTFVQNAGSGGQARYIMRYADSNSATTSSMYEDTSGRIGIKTTTPTRNLEVDGISESTVAKFITSDNNYSSIEVGDTGDVYSSIIFTSDSGSGEVFKYGNGWGSENGMVALRSSNGPIALQAAGTTRVFVTSAGNVGVRTTTPAYPLDINGANLQIGSVVVGRGLTPNTALLVGSGSLTVFTGSSSLTVYGNNALTSLTTGFANDAFGAYALNLTSTGSYNSAFGQSAGRRNNGSQNVFFGQFSGPFYHTLTGGFNTFIGPLSGIFSSGSAAKNTGIGASALYNLSDGIENTAIGSAALFDVTTGSGNIAFGFNTGRGITTGNGNLVIGNGITGLSSNLSNNIIIGDGQGNIKYRYADHNTTVSGSLSIQGSTTVVQQGIFVTGLTSLTVASISTGSYEAAFLDYMLSNGSNKRAGTLTVVWTASDIEWNDASTLDLGSTAGAEFTPTLAGSNANIVLAVPGGDWTVKGHLRYM